MRFSRAASVAFAVLLVLAVGSKIWLRGLNEEDGPNVEAQIAALASRNGFWTLPTERENAQMDRFAITRGSCTGMITVASPLGIHRSAIRMAAAPGERVYFVYRGRRSDDQPLWSTVTDHYLRRLGRLFGTAPAPHTLLGVAASPLCPPNALDWIEADGSL